MTNAAWMVQILASFETDPYQIVETSCHVIPVKNGIQAEQFCSLGNVFFRIAPILHGGLTRLHPLQVVRKNVDQNHATFSSQLGIIRDIYQRFRTS